MNLIKRTNIPKEASGIYQIQSKLNGKIYIGSAVNLKERKKNHFWNLKYKKHVNAYLQNHYNKYGKADLLFSILEFCEKEKLIEREQVYIDAWKPIFNICKIAGSILGVKYSEESKQKMSKAHIGKNTGKNNAMFGKQHSEKAKKKMSKAHIGKYHSEESKQKMRGKNNHMYGEHHSEETKQKISMIKKGKNHPNYGKHLSEETKQRISKAKIGKYMGKKNPMFGKQHTEETKQKLSISGREAWKIRRAKKEEKEQLLFKMCAA